MEDFNIQRQSQTDGRTDDFPWQYCALRSIARKNCSFNPLSLTVVIWVQLQSILCQTGLSRHL